MIQEINGKIVSIPEKRIASFMKSLNISKEEAIALYLDDEGITTNEEQQQLTKEAEQAVKPANIIKARAAKPKTQSERVKKPDEAKEEIVSTIAAALASLGTVNVTDPRKMIELTVKDENFKINLTRTRKST